MSKWFQKVVLKKYPYTLGGWKKTQIAKTRRANAISSRPKNKSLNNRRLSAGRALQALANVTNDKTTERLAKQDANYFFKLLIRK